MNIENLLPMVGSNPNLTLLHSLGDRFNSTFLQDQARRFHLLIHAHELPVVSFYETKVSPTAVKIDGRWKMAGPPAVLVTKESATHGRLFEDDIVPIDKTHSEIVKFEGPQDNLYYLVLHHLKRVGMERSFNPLESCTSPMYLLLS